MLRLQIIGNAWTLALRELRSGLSGFRIFSVCLALGVTAVVAVVSLSQAFLNGLAEQGRVLLGGDVAISLVHRPGSPSELSYLAQYGRTSEVVSMRAMAYAVDAAGRLGERQLIELKAVDSAYPLFGTLGLSPPSRISSALACEGAVCGAIAEQTLLDRLHVGVGGIVRVGVQDFRITSVLEQEPDRVAAGFSLGPHLLISTKTLPATGLVQTGSLINYTYRVALRRAFSPKELQSDAARHFPQAGWEIRTRDNAAPGIRSFVEQVTMFLMLAGLATLAIAGVGGAQAISAFLERKRDEIAILKSLGAEGATVFFVYFLQVLIIAGGAVVVGIGIGLLLPFCVEWFYASDLPLPARFGVYAQPIALGAGFGVLSAVAFSILPLSRARSISPAGLFRDLVAPSKKHGSMSYAAISAAFGLSIVAIALYLAPSRREAAEFLLGAVAILALLRLLATLLQAGLRRLTALRQPLVRLAVRNLTKPGSATTGVVTALGLGLSLLATMSLLNATVSAQVNGMLPEKAPTFFFVDIQPNETARFDAEVLRFKSASGFKRSPMIRGRIVALNGTPASKVRASSDARWVLAGDRGITYAAAPPDGTDITTGKWWPTNYTGPTLISFDGDLAPGLGLKLGDTITLNVLGREIEGRIANFRHVSFRNGQQNFVLILSPGLIDKAPHSFLATVRVSAADEEALYQRITDRFPNISVVRVKDSIAQVNNLIQELVVGVRLATLVTMLAGLLVLSGAIAAGGRTRLYDATIFKVLGATRGTILLAFAIEYGLLGLLTGAVAFGLGTTAAYAVSRWLLDIPFAMDTEAALTTIVGGAGLTLVFGLVGAWNALAAKPIRRLRAP